MMPEKSIPPAPGNSARMGRKAHARHRWHIIGHVALFIFLALVALQTAKLGIADLFVQTAQFEIDSWASARTPVSRRDFDRAARFFSAGLQVAADNPWALEGIGALDLARLRVSRVPREALALTQDSYARFRQARVQRPTSPYLWANIALAKLYVNEIDAEFLTALRHADQLGPWEPAVQQTVLFVGLAAWQELDPAMRQALARTIARGALHNAQKMFEIVKSYRRFDLVCAINNYRSIAGPDCGNSTAAK